MSAMIRLKVNIMFVKGNFTVGPNFLNSLTGIALIKDSFNDKNSAFVYP